MDMRTCSEFIGSVLENSIIRRNKMVNRILTVAITVFAVMIGFEGCSSTAKMEDLSCFPYEMKDGFQFWRLPDSYMASCRGKPKDIKVIIKGNNGESLYEIEYNIDSYPVQMHNKDSEEDVIYQYKYNKNKFVSAVVIDELTQKIRSEESFEDVHNGYAKYVIKKAESNKPEQWKFYVKGNTIIAEQYSDTEQFQREVDWHFGEKGLDLVEYCREKKGNKTNAEIYRTKISYDNLGKIVETREYAVTAESEQLIDSIIYTYNDKGLSSMRSIADGVDILYTFNDWDEMGNWTKMLNAAGDCLIERQISYY